jgi:hypothetical protein
LEAFKPYKWETFIFVCAEKDDTIYGGGYSKEMRAKVWLRFWRTELAQKQDGVWLSRPPLNEAFLNDDDLNTDHSDVPAERRKEYLKHSAERNKESREDGSDIRVEGPKIDEEGTTRIPYTETSWNALLAIRARILAAADQLETVTQRPDFVKKLSTIAAELKLLPGKEA